MIKFKILLLLIVFTTIGGIDCNSQNIYAARFKYFNSSNYKDFIYTSTQLTVFEPWATSVQYFSINTNSGYKFYIPGYKSMISLFRYSKEVRMDLVQYDDLISLSINSPIGASFNTIESSAEFSLSSFLAVQLPVLLQLNFFLNSSKVPIEKSGFNIGFGYQYFYLPFSFAQKDITKSDYIKSYGMKILKIGFVNSGKKNRMWGLDLRMGLDSKIYTGNYNFEDKFSCKTNYYYSLAYVRNLK